MAYKVEQLNAPLSVLGEGPHWDVETQDLYYIDIYGGTVNRYCMTENKTYTATIGNISLAHNPNYEQSPIIFKFQRTSPSSPSSFPWRAPRMSSPLASAGASE